nr:mannose-1-phosphate guanyltransferase alpha [Tanacetum cinerariifolium]
MLWIVPLFSQIGPNVSISTNARVRDGVRLINCIILNDVEIKKIAIIIHLIVAIGRRSRVEAEGDPNAKLGVTNLGKLFVYYRKLNF